LKVLARERRHGNGDGRNIIPYRDDGEGLPAEVLHRGGWFALVEVVGSPGSGPPPHIHHSIDEVYCLLEGELEVLDGDSTFTASAGSVFHIPKGKLHAWRNTTTKPARTLLYIVPAGFEGFFEEAGIPGSGLSSMPPPPTPENLQRMVELGGKYNTEYPPVSGW
jgi:quercetin dioxygenase-like cupin family protein